MKVHTVGYKSGPKGVYAFIVWETPLWVHLVHTIIDSLCSLTRHHFCGSRLMLWNVRLFDKNSKLFEVSTTKEIIDSYNTWRGWDFTTDEEDNEE